MMAFVRYFRRLYQQNQQRKRNPTSVFHADVNIDGKSFLGQHCALFKGASLNQSSVGSFTYIQTNSQINNAELGPFCSIGKNVTIGLAAHPIQFVSTSPVFFDPDQPLPKFLSSEKRFSETLPKTSIGPDVWIGDNVLVKSGVTVGVGAIIGAGAVVTRDVEPYSIVGGNPAKLIRMRFSENICSRLIKSNWWQLGLLELQHLAPYFCNPEDMLRRCGVEKVDRLP